MGLGHSGNNHEHVSLEHSNMFTLILISSDNMTCLSPRLTSAQMIPVSGYGWLNGWMYYNTTYLIVP